MASSLFLSLLPSLSHVVIIAIKGRGREIAGQQGGQLIANRRFQVDYDGCGDLSHLQKKISIQIQVIAMENL